MMRKRFKLAQNPLFQFQLLRDSLNNQISPRGFFYSRSAVNVLQCLIAIRFGEFRDPYSLFQVAFDRLDAARQRFPLDIAQSDPITSSGGNLSDAVSHRAGSEHGYA